MQRKTKQNKTKKIEEVEKIEKKSNVKDINMLSGQWNTSRV